MSQKKKNTQPMPPREAIYCAFQNDLYGKDSDSLPKRELKPYIKSHQSEAVKQLVRVYNLKNVTKQVRALLLQNVFKSPEKARARFPSLFNPAPEPSIGQAPTDVVESTQPEAAQLQAAQPDVAQAEAQPPQPETPTSVNAESSQEPATPVSLSSTLAPQNDPTNSCNHTRPPHTPIVHDSRSFLGKMFPLKTDTPDMWSPYPMRLPIQVQHKLLSNLQDLLETACFKYVKSAAPEILDRRGWTHPEAVELSKWTTEFAEQKMFFGSDPGINRSLEELYHSLGKMRHNAVHRARIEVSVVNRNIREAETLTMLMGDIEAQDILSKIRQEAQKASGAMVQNKTAIHAEYEKTMKSIESQRALLVAQEEQIKITVQKGYLDEEEAAGEAFEQAVAKYGIVLGTVGIRVMPTDASVTVALAKEEEKEVVGCDKEQEPSQMDDATGVERGEEEKEVLVLEEEMSGTGETEQAYVEMEQDVDEEGQKHINGKRDSCAQEDEEHLDNTGHDGPNNDDRNRLDETQSLVCERGEDDVPETREGVVPETRVEVGPEEGEEGGPGEQDEVSPGKGDEVVPEEGNKPEKETEATPKKSKEVTPQGQVEGAPSTGEETSHGKAAVNGLAKEDEDCHKKGRGSHYRMDRWRKESPYQMLLNLITNRHN